MPTEGASGRVEVRETPLPVCPGGSTPPESTRLMQFRASTLLGSDQLAWASQCRCHATTYTSVGCLPPGVPAIPEKRARSQSPITLATGDLATLSRDVGP